MSHISVYFSADDPRLQTNTGLKENNIIRISKESSGIQLFGPYINLEKGTYISRLIFAMDYSNFGDAIVEVTGNHGQTQIALKNINLNSLHDSGLNYVELLFSLDRQMQNCEVRLNCFGNMNAFISGLEIIRTGIDSGLTENILNENRKNIDMRQYIDKRLGRIELLCGGGQAAYIGNNRVMLRMIAGDRAFAFLMPADDLLIMPISFAVGGYETGLTSLFVNNINLNDNCLDIGANYGYYTCLFSSLAPYGKTLGIEPDRSIFELMRDNININGFGGVATAVHAAVSDRSGVITLYRRMNRSGNTSIIHPTDEYVGQFGEPSAEAFDVHCTSVDNTLEYFNGKLDIIKIDVEGAEPLVFQGMDKCISINPNINIVMEWSPAQINAAGFNLDDFLDKLELMNFQAKLVGTETSFIELSDLKNCAYSSGVLLTLKR